MERELGLDAPGGLSDFGRQGLAVADSFRQHLIERRDAGVSVAGYGAPSKAPVLLALASIDESLLPYTVDLSPEKEGRRLPATKIPIFLPEELIRRQPEEVVVLTWDIVDEVVAQLAATGVRDRLESPFLCAPTRSRVRGGVAPQGH